MKLLIIEDEKITRISLTNTLQKEGYEVYSAMDGEEGINIFNSILPPVVITDLRLPKLGGIEILNSVLKTLPTCKVILITAFATVDTAVTALKMGAYDYLTKPFSPEKLMSILRNIGQLQSVMIENLELRNKLNSLENRTIIGNSYSIKKLIETINQIASNDSTVLIEGESGTGKELVARALHQAGIRRNENFIAISCSSIPESLLESELFGYEKGAFTGAIKKHIGYFERANKGTLFIDDIDDFPLSMQVKLLRVIQERELVPIGSNQSVYIDVRIVCATKVDLKKKVEQKLFREDLFYRLNIIPLKIPPIRERREDIPILVEHFFKKHHADDKIMLLTKEIYSKLIEYDWPGNVRELENIVQRLIALSLAGKIDTDILDFSVQNKPMISDKEDFDRYSSFDEFILKKEKEMIEWALAKTQNNISNAAKLLNIPRTTLNSKLERLSIKS
jgi:two-component system response regulator AtoC